uniref:Reverse transcriptase domain-containing protein n=1 Tax=Tanacetum cinerariifolium TaxID=118510 RepID=A0A6L2M5E0_TANCI|nr:reverse transcriptase domain-containing protein [Tanacetum cinerariifolium]
MDHREGDDDDFKRCGPNNNNNENENPDIATIIAQQLQTILPHIVTQVTNNVNNANGRNGGNGRNNGCTYKGFIACNPKEYDGKGGAIALTRWIKKMENVINNSGCAENQKVKYVASSFMNKALTLWNTQVQARGREATIGMSWADFKALLVEEFCPSNEVEKLKSEFWNHKMVGSNHAGYTDQFHELAKLVPHLVTPESLRIKRAGILTDEAVSYGIPAKGNEKRKGVEESSKQGGGRNKNKRAKGNPQQALKDKGVIDSGCSRHVIGNISYLSDFEEIKGGYVAFGGNPKGGKITGKSKIKTGKLDFDDVYLVKELKFNFFSVSQINSARLITGLKGLAIGYVPTNG